MNEKIIGKIILKPKSLDIVCDDKINRGIIMEEKSHYYVLTEVFDENAVANYVMHSPEALLSVAS